MFNVIVTIKQTMDTEASIVIKDDTSLDFNMGKLILNPYDEFALEEAIKLSEKMDGNVVAVSAGIHDPSEALRHCLAMGANQAVWLDCSDLDQADGYAYANIMASWVKKQKCDLVLCGREAIDDASGEFPVYLAEFLALPHVLGVTALEIEGESLTATREIEGGYVKVKASLPCLVSAQKGLNEPRTPSIRSVLKARKQEVIRVALDELELTKDQLSLFTSLLTYLPAPTRPPGEMWEGSTQDIAAKLIAVVEKQGLLGE